MKAFLLNVFSVAICCNVFGQVEFYNGTLAVLGEEEVNSTICIGFEDLNGDLLDDLFLLDKGKVLKTFIQGAPTQPFEFKEHLQVSVFGDWSFMSGDLDNDGIPEIICNGYEDGSQFLKLVGDTYTTMFKKGNVYSQNSNLVDLNEDGFLDFFLCNDIGASLTFLNDGSGDMIETYLIDFQTTPEDDMSGNYSSIFTDIDGDDDLDLYIGKCKAGVFDPADPRRINTLYINNGDGTYTESGAAFGLDNGAQSWSVDAGDVDNDGDVDIIIANHDRAHDLMINDGNGHFDRKALIPGGYESYAYQSFFTDFDNNGWLDIFITDPSATFILFNDEMSFTRRDVLVNERKAFSGATGDLNSDGFPDLYLGFATSFQNASLEPDRIFINEGNTNNFLDINLTGTISNRDAIGSKVTIYHEGKIQYREVVAGKSYGIMNTTIVHFGLGKTTEVDSIFVKWPSGMVTKIDEVAEINTLLSITEDGCVTPTYHMPDLQLCDGDSIEVELPIEFEDVKWSNGQTASSIWISEPGWYNVVFRDNGCLTRSSYFEVVEEQELQPNEILTVHEITACKGDVVELEAYPGVTYFWSTGETSQVIEVLESGIYNVTMSTNCNNYISDGVDVFFAENETPVVENDSVLLGESAMFSGDSELLNWYQNKNDLVPLGMGSEFITPEIFEDQTYYVGEVTEGFGFNESLMTAVPLNNIGDSTYSINEFVEFEVIDELILYSVRVRTQNAGVRRMVVLQDGEELTSYEVDLIAGINRINLDIQLSPGTYLLGTDAEVNQSNLGTDHPQLSYSKTYVEADRQLEGFLNVKGSELYPGVTSYFFDWEIYYGYFYCEPRVPVHAIIKTPVSTDELNPVTVIYPNPTSGQITIQTDMNTPYRIDVFDVSGQKVLNTIHSTESRTTMDMPNASGVYFMKMTNGKAIEMKKIYVH